MFNIYENKVAFLHLKPKNLKWLIIVFGTITFAPLISISKIEVYDNYQTKGYIENGALKISVPENINFEKIKMNNEEIEYEIISKTLKDNQNDYTLRLSTELKENEIVSLDLYYNKERIIEKI